MNATHIKTLVPATLALLAAASNARAQTIIDLGTLPGGTATTVHAISLDGTTAVGDSAYLGFRWTESAGIESLGKLLGAAGSMARAVNTDGTAIAGFNSSSAGQRAIRWNTTERNRNLGSSAGGVAADAKGISGDGLVVVGFSTNGGTHAYRWTIETGMVSLGFVPGGTSSIAMGISNDGSVIVGQGNTSAGTRAFRWTSAGGMLALAPIPGTVSSTGLGVSADGSTTFGYCGPAAAAIPFRHTLASGMTTVQLPAGVTSAQANASNADGSILILDVQHATDGQRPYRWTPPADPIDLNAELASRGVDLTGWVLRTAFLSGDGSSIAGTGDHLGQTRSYIIRGIGCDNAPTIAIQPNPTSACPQGAALFTVTPSGVAPFAFHWRREGVPLDTIANPSAATAALTISNASSADAGWYDCVVSDSGGCRSVFTTPVQLFYDPADVGAAGGVAGRDGQYDNNDFIVFIDLFFNQQAAADLGSQGGRLGSDGQFDNNDFIAFINQFFAGCS